MDSKRRTRKFWKQLSAEVDRGESLAQVARRHHVRPKTLSWWRWHLRRVQKSEPLPMPRILPVHLPKGEAVVGRSPFRFEVRVGRVRIRADAGTDVEYVAALVVALRARC